MKKLALAIGLGAYIAFSAWSVTGTNARLLFLNEALYPDTNATVVTVTSSRGAHGNQERADMAQPSSISTDTQRLFCEGDICLVP